MNKFNFPHSLLAKIFDVSGTTSGGNRGFVIAYIDSEGNPAVIHKYETACVRAALFDALKTYVESREILEEQEREQELFGEDE